MAATVAALVRASNPIHVHLSSHVSSQLEKPHLYPPFIVDGKPIHPPLYELSW